MDHDPWLVKEVRRLTSDLHQLQQSMELVPHKFTLGYADAEQVVVLGKGEWDSMAERVDDSRKEIVQQLNDFIENEYNRQLHWSALRMLTASGVLGTELASYHRRLVFIVEHPGDDADAEEPQRLVRWFEGQLMAFSDRLSVRLLQIVSRMLDPQSWEISGTISNGGGDVRAPMTLTMRFHPNTEDRARKQREKEQRLRRVRLD